MHLNVFNLVNTPKMFINEGALNYPSMTARRRQNAAHGIEVTGGKLACDDALDSSEQDRR